MPLTPLEDWVLPHDDAASSSSVRVNVTRAGIVDRVVVVQDDEEFQELGVCHMALFGPHSFLMADDDGVQRRHPFLDAATSVGGTAAFALALDQLNRGDGRVVAAVEGLNERCPVRFTGELFDTGLSQRQAATQTLQVLERQTVNSTTYGQPQQREVCSFIGATGSAITIPMATITSVFGRPQLSAWSTSSQLDDRTDYPLFGRIITSEKGLAPPLVRFLQQQPNIRHLGVLHWNDPYGVTYVSALLQAARQWFPELQIVAVNVPRTAATAEDYARAAQVLAQTRFRWFFGLVGYADFVGFMTEADKVGIVGGPNVWLFHGTSMAPLITQTVVEKGAARSEEQQLIHKALRGVGMISFQGGRPGMPVFDRFVQEWKALGDSAADLELIAAMQPRYPDEPDFVPPVVDASVLETDPARYASVIFDETILLGLAACQAVQSGGNNNDTTTTPPIHLEGSTMFETLLATSFEGATGRVTLDPATGSRVPATALFRMLNVVEQPLNATHVTFGLQDSHLFNDGRWKEQIPYVFADGTTNVPSDLPGFHTDYNYIGTALRSAGIAMASLILLTSLVFATWTARKRNLHVVKSSQPIFLLILTAGTFILGATILPLSIDDEIASDKGCDIACMAVPWLASTGFALIFAALFSKTWRVNRLFRHPEMRRVRISAMDVMSPLIVLMVLNVIVLVVWTTVSPLHWLREATAVDVFGRTIESRGYCTSDHFLPFVIILVAMDIGALVFTSYQSYVARAIATEFAESEYIGKSIFCMLLVSFVGVPTMILVSEEPRAHYFVLTSIIFVLCSSVLLFIFIPKLLAVAQRSHGSSQTISRTMSDSIRRSSAAFWEQNSSRFSARSLTRFTGEAAGSRGANDHAGGDISDESGIGILKGPVHVENEKLRAQVEKLQKELCALLPCESPVDPVSSTNAVDDV